MTTETDYATGIQSRIRAALKDVADEVAVKSTRIAIAVPGQEIAAAMWKIFNDVPHIPDYDPENGKRTWSSAVEFASDEIPEDPAEVSVRATTGDLYEQRVTITLKTADGVHEVELDRAQAEEFFLTGLSATTFLLSLGGRGAPEVD